MTASRHRPIVVLLFALLLLGMQHRVQVHALQHLDAKLHPRQAQVMPPPVADALCLECALQAAGTSVIPADIAATSAPASRFGRVDRAITTRRLAAPSYYASRAPPPLL